MTAISVVCSTMNRERFLPGMYRCFDSQTWAEKTLVVYDNSAHPSEFFSDLKDPRVRYVHDPARKTLGAARNALAELATGELLAFFDDDDFYAPKYLEWMQARLGDDDLVKLDAWFAYSMNDVSLFYWNTKEIRSAQFEVGKGTAPAQSMSMANMGGETFVDHTSLGYGFSWVMKRSIFEHTGCPDHNFSEDYVLVDDLRKRGGKIKTVPDETGIMAHVLHGSNGSWCYPQYLIPPWIAVDILPGLVGRLVWPGG